MNEHCSIIVLNYNGFQDTLECINSLKKHLSSNYSIVLVDNASTDQSVSVFKDLIEKGEWKEITLLEAKQNNGFSAGNNLGLNYAKTHFQSNYFWLLNNDTCLKDDALSPLIHESQNQPNVGILGSLLLFYDRPNTAQGIGGRLNRYTGKFEQVGFNKRREEIDALDKEKLDFVIGASLFVNRSFLDKVGLLAEDYFLYFEEIDWSLRAKEKGFYTQCCLGSIVYHKQGKATGNKVNGKKNKKAMYFHLANLILLYRKFFPGLIWVSYLMVTLRCIKFALLEDISYLKLWYRVVFKKREHHFE